MTTNSEIVVYSSPFCGYCGAAKRLLDRKGVAYCEINVMFDPDKRAEMVARSGRQTVPQVFLGDRHLGGFDDLDALDKRGELDRLLTAAAISFNP